MNFKSLFVKDNDSPTWLGWLLAGVASALGALGLLLCGGCVNCYVRCPGTDVRVEHVYQSTAISAAMAYIVAFPQKIGSTGAGGLMWENVFTVPLGCLCLADTVCEAALDTVCLPVDAVLSENRKNAQ